jgi:hypothetical protein
MEHESDKMKVANYAHSSRFLVAKSSRGNSFSLNQQVSLHSRSGEIIYLNFLSVFMEASDI